MFRILVILALALQPGLPYASEVIAATERFELRSSPRVNLHHFLVAWASAEAGQWPPYALPVADRDYRLALPGEGDWGAWDAAVAAYAAANGRSVTFDAGLISLRDWAAGAAPLDQVRLQIAGWLRRWRQHFPCTGGTGGRRMTGRTAPGPKP